MEATVRNRRAGDFSGHVVVGPYDFHIADFDQDRQIYGMGQRVIWPYGGLRDAAGNLYVLERKFVHQMTGGLWIMHNCDGALKLVPAAVFSARGEVRRELCPERHIYRDHLMAKLGAMSPAEEQPFYFEVSDDDLCWQEGELCDLRGHSLGPGLQAFFLGDEFPWLYFSRAFWVTGTILGEPVSGIAGYEHSYWRERAEWKELPYYARQQLAWSLFCNQYEDGSIEWGHIICNRGGVGALMVANEKQALLTTGEFDSSFRLDNEGYVGSATYQADGDGWQFTADSGGHMTQFNTARWGGYLAQSGVIRRIGDTRTPTYSFTWLEAFADRIADEGLSEG